MAEAVLNRICANVFGYSEHEPGHRFGFLVDVPIREQDDTPSWKARRAFVMACAEQLRRTHGHACMVYAFGTSGKSGVERTNTLNVIPLNDDVPPDGARLAANERYSVDIREVFTRAEFWIALTQYSLTSFLKMSAAQYGFRALSIPGYTSAMAPSLLIDAVVLETRTKQYARRMTGAQAAHLEFGVGAETYALTLDLRHRMGFALPGRFLFSGLAGNLPAGEAYIVPYEGEKSGVVSRSNGILPIEYEGQTALCEIEENRIVCIDGNHSWAERLRRWVALDPARANVAKLGFGILGEWGIEPVGNKLFDEKLSLHIGIGRSEHLGGVTAPADFRSPHHVGHVCYCYHRATMPHVRVLRGSLVMDEKTYPFMKNDRYIFE